jgi:1-acyl-sn-glycerol-3-phosphate acyltransferase
MINREAFDEGFEIAGWWLQRLGSFSVERGGPNQEAKRYAIDVVQRGHEVLGVFPEGDISCRYDGGQQAVRHRGAEQLRDTIQALIPTIITHRRTNPDECRDDFDGR